MMKYFVCAALCVTAVSAFAQDQKKAPPAPPLMMTIPDLKDAAELPVKFSCSGSNEKGVSPHITWKNTPNGTQSFALLLHDPEPHPQKSIYDVTHWFIYDIPATATELPEGLANGTVAGGAKQLKNIRGFDGYFGPCAPPIVNHHYTWELYAVDTKLNLAADATRADAMKALDGHILGTAVYVTLFKRAQ